MSDIHEATERRLKAERDALRERVVQVGHSVRVAAVDAVDAFLRKGADEAFALALQDRAVNRLVRGLEHDAYQLASVPHADPAHQRFPSAVLRICIAVERIGDYAASVARATVRLREPPPSSLAEAICVLRDQGSALLGDALLAFQTRDDHRAARCKARAKRFGRDYAAMHDALLAGSHGVDLGDVVSFAMVMHRLQRVIDQAKNICEETMFELTGQRKGRKRYNILFLDRDSALYAPLAVALAQQRYPNSAAYAFGSPNPASVADPRLFRLGEQLGLDFGFVQPQRVAPVRAALEGYHVIVELGTGVNLPVSEVPYSSVLLKWVQEVQGPELLASVGALQNKLATLVGTLHGDDAD